MLHGSKSRDLMSGTQYSDVPVQYSVKSHGSMLFRHIYPLGRICEENKKWGDGKTFHSNEVLSTWQ